jgi:hypothetical protein
MQRFNQVSNVLSYMATFEEKAEENKSSFEEIVHQLFTVLEDRNAIMADYPQLDFPPEQEVYTMSEWRKYHLEYEAASIKKIEVDIKFKTLLRPLDRKIEVLQKALEQIIPRKDTWFITDAEKYAIGLCEVENGEIEIRIQQNPVRQFLPSLRKESQLKPL